MSILIKPSYRGCRGWEMGARWNSLSKATPPCSWLLSTLWLFWASWDSILWHQICFRNNTSWAALRIKVKWVCPELYRLGAKKREHQNPPGKPQSKNWHIFGHCLNRPLLPPTKWPLWCNFQQYLKDPDQRHRPLWNLITFHIIRHSCTHVICIMFTYTDTFM